MINDVELRNKLFELKDKSILSWISEDEQTDIIEAFRFIPLSKGTMIHEKVSSDDFVILLSGKSTLVSRDTNATKDNVLPGRSFELQKYVSKTERAYNWVAADDVVIGLTSYKNLEDLLIRNKNLDYLKRISSVVELQKLKNDLRMLGVNNRVTKEIIEKLTPLDGPPAEGQFCVLSAGEVKILDPDNEQELRTLKISDYFVWKSSFLTVENSEDARFWGLETEFLLSEKLDPAIYSFFDVLTELETAKEKAGEVVEETPEEPLDIADFEISHFKKTNELPLLPSKRKPVALRQHDAMDCGAACMAMISQYYKRQITISTWRRLIHVTREGASMLSVKMAADKVGFDTIGVMSGVKALTTFTTPFIALMAYHYVVVYAITEKEVVVADPARGLVTISIEEFTKDYSKNCLLIRPNERLLEYPQTPPAYKKYLGLFNPHLGDMIQIILFSAIIFLMGLIPPLFTQYIFDTVIPSGKTDTLTLVSIASLVFLLLMMGLSFVRLSFLIKIASTIGLKLTSLFFRQTLRLPFGYFSVRNVGDITTRVDELERIRGFFTGSIIQIILNILSISVYSTILLVYDSSFFYLILISMLVTGLIMSPIFGKLKDQMRDVFHSSGKASSISFEQFSGLRTIQNLTATMQGRWRWEEKQAAVLESRQKIQHLNSSAMSVSVLMQQLISLAFFGLAIYLFLERKITIGQVVAASSISGMIIGPMLGLIQSVDDIGQLKISFEKIDEIVTSKVEEESGKVEFPKKFETIHFKDIWFKYGSDFSPWILKNINLEVKRGQKIAFVGMSGSGKSTLSYMLNLIYSPQKGEVIIGDVNNQEINLTDLRANISMIVQDNAVLSGTILSNICLGDPSANLGRAVEAAKMAEAHDFIMGLPQGYETLVGGEHGLNISGGQRQRISIARAIYKSPAIMIMDEATSALDTITEKKVMTNIFQKLKDTTCFIIAHRFNTIMTADLIVVVKAGVIVEMGTHEQLIKLQKNYFGMFKKQVQL
jgi:subfamily B ATP-binding cassette protein HlyB/CyaB